MGRKGETRLRSPNASRFLVLSIACDLCYVQIRALKANAPGLEHVYPLPLLAQLMAPVVLGSGPPGQCQHLASSAPGLHVFSHEELKNVNGPKSTHVPGSLAEVGSSWLCWGLFLQTPQRAAGPVSFVFHVAGRGLFYFLSASNQGFIFPLADTHL